MKWIKMVVNPARSKLLIRSLVQENEQLCVAVDRYEAIASASDSEIIGLKKKITKLEAETKAQREKIISISQGESS